MTTASRDFRQARGSAARWLAWGPATVLAALLLVPPRASAEPAKADPAAAIGGGAMARVLPPVEKIKVLEEELAAETERRMKAEQESARRQTEANELAAAGKIAARERVALEARLGEGRERETQWQRTNDRLREDNERIATAVRLSLPIVTAACIAILVLLIWAILFLRKLAARVHDQHTLVEMHQLEARLTHTAEQYTAELKRNQTLRGKLAELGIVDEEAPRTPSGQWRTR
jgi:hypothetical protein